MKQNYAIPDWLNKKFLIEVIKANNPVQEEDIEITKFDVDYATNKGDNYASEMFRVIYSCKIKKEKLDNVRIIVKCRYDKPEIHKVIEPFGFYKTEIELYSMFIPEFEKILQEVEISVKLAPKCMYFDKDKDVLVLEDESPNGFRNGDKHKRFNLKAAHMLLTKLAYYHAASVIYNERNNNFLESKVSKMFSPEIESYKDTMDKMVKAFVDEVSSWPGYEYYIPKLQAFQKHFNSVQHQTLGPIDGFNCLIHGDLWLNNLLVKFQNNDDSLPLDLLLIDLQIASWTSPVIDLHYFFYTTLNEEDYQNRLDELIQFYHGVLSSTLKKLNYHSIPSLHQLQIDFVSKYFHALFGGILVKSIIYVEDTTNADAEHLFNGDSTDLQNKNYKNNRFREEIKYLIRLVDQKGVFDLSLNIK